MIFDSYFAMDKLVQIEKKLAILDSLISMNGDGSQQQNISVLCEDVRDKLSIFSRLVGELNTDRLGAFYRHLGFIERHPRLARANFEDIESAAWKDYCCKKLKFESTLDGHALIDRLFSSSGMARGDRGEDIEKAFQDYCKSSFTFFRNKLSHNLYQAVPYEVDAALSAINLMLIQVDKCTGARS